MALWIAEQLLENYLLPIVALINNKDYDAAVVMYQNMVNVLKENYGIDDSIEDIAHYDQLKGGHGYAYTKVPR